MHCKVDGCVEECVDRRVLCSAHLDDWENQSDSNPEAFKEFCKRSIYSIGDIVELETQTALYGTRMPALILQLPNPGNNVCLVLTRDGDRIGAVPKQMLLAADGKPFRQCMWIFEGGKVGDLVNTPNGLARVSQVDTMGIVCERAGALQRVEWCEVGEIVRPLKPTAHVCELCAEPDTYMGVADVRLCEAHRAEFLAGVDPEVIRDQDPQKKSGTEFRARRRAWIDQQLIRRNSHCPSCGQFMCICGRETPSGKPVAPPEQEPPSPAISQGHATGRDLVSEGAGRQGSDEQTENAEKLQQSEPESQSGRRSAPMSARPAEVICAAPKCGRELRPDQIGKPLDKIPVIIEGAYCYGPLCTYCYYRLGFEDTVTGRAALTPKPKPKPEPAPGYECAWSTPSDEGP